MRRPRSLPRPGLSSVAAVVVLMTVVSLAVGWLRDPAPMDADDAAAFSARAFTLAGVDGAVTGAPVQGQEAGRCPSSDPGCVPPIYDVWQTTYRTDQGDFELSVIRRGSARGQANVIRDFDTEGEAVLDDEQLARIDRFSHDPPRDEWRQENVTGTAAGFALVGALALVVWVRRAAAGDLPRSGMDPGGADSPRGLHRHRLVRNPARALRRATRRRGPDLVPADRPDRDG